MKWFALWVSMVLAGAQAQAVSVEKLSQEATSWDGKSLHYPAGQAELSIMRIQLKAGETLPYHCHPVPSAAYVTSGHLRVELKDGSSKEFRAGDTITEVVGRLHKGTNLSNQETVELIVFYSGADGIPLTYHGKELHRCHE